MMMMMMMMMVMMVMMMMRGIEVSGEVHWKHVEDGDGEGGDD